MVGTPGAYDYGPERCSWLTHHLTNWMGDDGFLHKSSCKIRRHNPEGDMRLSAKSHANMSKTAVTWSTSTNRPTTRMVSCQSLAAAPSSYLARLDSLDGG